MLFVFILFFTRSVYSQNSENVTQIGHWEYGSCLAVAVTDTLAYVVAESDGMHIIDISNQAKPKEIGIFKTIERTTCVAASGSYAYIDEYINPTNSYLRIIDITNPIEPVELGSLILNSVIREIVVRGSYAYIAADRTGLHIIDITNPSLPKEVGFFDLEGTNGALVNGVAVSDSYAYVTDEKTGLHIVDITNPTQPIEVGFFNMELKGSALKVTVKDSNAYLTNGGFDLGGNGLHIIDISDPTNPSEISFFNEWIPFDVAVIGSYVYLTCFIEGLRLLDITNSSTPVTVGFFKSEGRIRDVVVNSSYVYVTDERNGLYILQNDLLVGVKENLNSILQKFNLEQNYPNPFNPTTTINYSVRESGFVQLKVYDVLGKEIATLVKGEKSAGNYSVKFNGNNLPSGVYFYTLRINNFVQGRKMILLR